MDEFRTFRWGIAALLGVAVIVLGLGTTNRISGWDTPATIGAVVTISVLAMAYLVAAVAARVGESDGQRAAVDADQETVDAGQVTVQLASADGAGREDGDDARVRAPVIGRPDEALRDGDGTDGHNDSRSRVRLGPTTTGTMGTDRDAPEKLDVLVETLEQLEVAAMNTEIALAKSGALDGGIEQPLGEVHAGISDAQRHADALESIFESPQSRTQDGIHGQDASGSESGSSSIKRESSSYAANSVFGANHGEESEAGQAEEQSTADPDGSTRADADTSGIGMPEAGIAESPETTGGDGATAPRVSDGGQFGDVPQEIRELSIAEDEIPFEELLEL